MIFTKSICFAHDSDWKATSLSLSQPSSFSILSSSAVLLGSDRELDEDMVAS